MTVDAAYLMEQGYLCARRLPSGEWIGLHRMAYTTGLMVGLDETGYQRRYCYENLEEALIGYTRWEGEGDPPGRWIKEKGRRGGDRLNPAWGAEAAAEIAVVHVLRHGLPLCGFSRELPRDWPAGHRWVGLEDGEDAAVSCPGCQAALRARAAYRDDSCPTRECDACRRLYRGPAVYCSLECAIGDA